MIPIQPTLKEQILEKLKIFESDPQFKFDEPTHKYTYGKQTFISVTTFLKNFEKEFDTEYWSTKKATDRLVSEEKELTKDNILEYKEIILKEWKDKTDTACDIGSQIHLYIESRFKDINEKFDTSIYDEDIQTRLKLFEKVYDKRLFKLTPIAQEVRIFSKRLKLAGTFDALFEHDGELYIFDWKTNKKFTTDKDFSFSNLLPPFHNYKHNKLNIYSIQVSIYRLILESVGIFIKDCVLVHIPLEGEAILHKTKDFRKELLTFFGGSV